VFDLIQIDRTFNKIQKLNLRTRYQLLMKNRIPIPIPILILILLNSNQSLRIPIRMTPTIPTQS
jgi:hypothetical protein